MAATTSPHGCRRATIAAMRRRPEMLKAATIPPGPRPARGHGVSVCARGPGAAPRASRGAACPRRCADTRSRSGTSASSSIEAASAAELLSWQYATASSRRSIASMSHSGCPRRRRNRRAPIDGRRQVERREQRAFATQIAAGGEQLEVAHRVRIEPDVVIRRDARAAMSSRPALAAWFSRR